MSEPNKKSFNLIDEPWIPVAAEKELRSLRAIFSGVPPRDLSGNPVEKIVLFRFLLSIAHASVTIADTLDDVFMAVSTSFAVKRKYRTFRFRESA